MVYVAYHKLAYAYKREWKKLTLSKDLNGYS